MKRIMMMILIIASLVLIGCREECDVVAPSGDEILIIIVRVDTDCPPKVRCIFYDTIYHSASGRNKSVDTPRVDVAPPHPPRSEFFQGRTPDDERSTTGGGIL